MFGLQRKKVKLAEFKLNSLLEITQAINTNDSAHDLLEKYRKILCEGLKVRTLAVFLVNEDWEKVLSVGLSDTVTANAGDIASALLRYKTVTTVKKNVNPLLRYIDIIIPVFHKENPLAYVLVGGEEPYHFWSRSQVFQNIDVIQTLSNIVVVALENKRLYKGSLQQELLNKELEVASKLQTMLIPTSESLPVNPYITVATFYKPYSLVGGDYYDFMKMNDEEYGFCIGDVSGKGISAAIMMANFQANLHILFQHNIPLTNVIRDLNQIVYKNAQGDRFVTFFLARYNGRTHTLHYINAGHNPPLLLQKQSFNLLYLSSGCVGLGMLENIPQVVVGSIHIEPGDKLLCYTDGVTESQNTEGESLGTVPLEGAITIDGTIDDVVFYLRSELNKFIDATPLTDDISIMGIDFK
jgi:sigma-B regulation protein RsbU (phosphoserine phosphatase)